MTESAEQPTPRDHRSAVSILGEPTRRALYDYIVEVGDWVGRDEAGDALSLERGTAAHHLERLTDEGLLEVGFQRLSGRQGPGAGRPAKLYRRAHHDIDVSLPPRDYKLAGEILATAVDLSRSDSVDIGTALDDAATAAGRQSAAAAEARLSSEREKSSTEAARQVVVDVLRSEGYEPQTRPDDRVILRNCPFHQLAQLHTDLICGMNLCFVSAAVDSIGNADLDVHLAPHEGRCCVELRPSHQADPA
ncbi:MAG: transcriptional regulator [Aquihabitans sp.]